MHTIDTEISFSADMLDTADLGRARDELLRRREQSGICAHCEREIEETQDRLLYGIVVSYRHIATRNVLCAEDEALDGGSQATPSEDPLDEDERDVLEKLDELWHDFGQDLETSHTLINDDYFEAYARDEAEDVGVPEFIASYVDWGRYADHLQADYSTVEVGGYTFHYSG